MTRISAFLFGASVVLHTSSTFASDCATGCGNVYSPVTSVSAGINGCSSCGTSCAPVGCVTAITNGCAGCGVISQPVGCGSTVTNQSVGCGASSGSVGCGTTSTSSSSCPGGCTTQHGVVIANGSTIGHVGTISGGNATGNGNGVAIDNRSGSENNGGTGNIPGPGDNSRARSPLDPDVLTGGTGDSAQGISTLQDLRNTQRFWTDSTGKYKRLARFDRMDGNIVVLKNSQGRTTRIDIMRLSTADQSLVNELWKVPTARWLPSSPSFRIAKRR